MLPKDKSVTTLSKSPTSKRSAVKPTAQSQAESEGQASFPLIGASRSTPASLKKAAAPGLAKPATAKPAATQNVGSSRSAAAKSTSTKKSAAAAPAANLGIDTPVQFVKGVGPKLGSVFSARGIDTVRDLLTFFPRAYED